MISIEVKRLNTDISNMQKYLLILLVFPISASAWPRAPRGHRSSGINARYCGKRIPNPGGNGQSSGGETSNVESNGSGDNGMSEVQIIGGRLSRSGDIPWQVALDIDTINGSFFCGGSIINQRWILTAAHCFYGPRVTKITITLGSTTHERPAANAIITHAENFWMHPDYDYDYNDNDIALVKMRITLELPGRNGQVINSICLPYSGQEFSGRVTVSGWGLTDPNDEETTENLRQVTVPLISLEDCEDYYGGLASTLICAGAHRVSAGSCEGDSGGPLFKTSNRKATQVGIVSFGQDLCTEPDAPGAYTEVSQFTGWIRDMVKQNS